MSVAGVRGSAVAAAAANKPPPSVYADDLASLYPLTVGRRSRASIATARRLTD